MSKKEIPISYIKDGIELEPTPYFLYEVSIYKISKNSAELVGCKFYKSEKPISNFKSSVYSKYDRKHPPEYRYAKFIDWLGAPIDFIKENNFKLVDHTKEKRKKKK